jgi:hypothetical protein
VAVVWAGVVSKEVKGLGDWQPSLEGERQLVGNSGGLLLVS